MGDILGLPLHPLVVHAVVVLVPLVAVGMVLAALSRTWADRLRLVLAVLAVSAAGAAFVARASGESLLGRVPGTAEVARHADAAGALPFAVLGTAALVVGWAWLQSRGRPARGLGFAAALAALAASAWTVVVGHLGAEAVWGGL